MLQEVEICTHVLVPHADLSKRSIVRTLMLQLWHEKACKQQGYFLAMTKLKSIGKEPVLVDDNFFFWVDFRGRMFLPQKGETSKGVVYLAKRLGVFIKCEPAKHLYLSARKMPGYHLVAGDVRCFQNEQLDRIERGVVVRFKVLDVKWEENQPENNIEREFLTIASLETGEPFGPVSLPGFYNSEK